MPRRALVAAALLAALGATAAAGAGAATGSSAPKPVVAHDAKGDVRSPLDLTRFSFGRGSDGRLRASITLASAWTGDDLIARDGPPGSICVKVWTASAPPDAAPDYLLCVTADRDKALRGSVLRERANKLPERVASARVSRPSRRTVTIRVAQSTLGSPAKLEVAAESTRPGCPRASCIDTAPDAPATLALTLRKAAA